MKNVRSSGPARSPMIGCQLVQEVTVREFLVYVVQSRSCRLCELFQHIRLSLICNVRVTYIFSFLQRPGNRVILYRPPQRSRGMTHFPFLQCRRI
jgi:hypothetical protein